MLSFYVILHHFQLFDIIAILRIRLPPPSIIIILNNSARDSESVQKAFSKFRYIPDEFSAPTTTFVYGNKAAIIIWSDIPIATVITSKEVSKSYLSYFEILWKNSKKRGVRIPFGSHLPSRATEENLAYNANITLALKERWDNI